MTIEESAEYEPEWDEDAWTPENDIGTLDIYCQLAVRLDRDADDRGMRTQDVITLRLYCPSEGGYHEVTLMRDAARRLARALRFFDSHLRNVGVR